MDINRFFDGLSAIFASGKNEQVSDYLRKNLAEAEADSDDQAVITILNEMVGYYRITSNHAESLKAAERALNLMRRLGYEDTIHYGTTLLNAATAYRVAGDKKKALQLFNSALVIYLRELPAEDERLAALYNNLSSIHQDAKEYEKAAEYLEKSAAILSKIKGAEIDAATVYTNLALAMIELGREREAMETLQKAVNLFKGTTADGKVEAKAAPHYASTVAGLAGAYYKMKDYAKAAALYEEALTRIKEAYGENDDYFVTCRNCAAAYELAENLAKALAYRMIAEAAQESVKTRASSNKNQTNDPSGISTPGLKAAISEQLNGLALAKAYYEAYGNEMIRSRFPSLAGRVAAGLVGEGSECFGFDDEISRDHDFGPSFCLWLTRNDYTAAGAELQKAYEALPKEFMGFAARTDSAPHTGRRVGVLCIPDFYTRYTGSPDASLLSLSDWLRIPENSLATVTNGEVFSDPSGEFSRIRAGFMAYYPDDVRLKKIAAGAALMAQSGQVNYARCMSRGESVGAYLALGEFARHAAAMVFLLNRKYAPFYKWTHRAMRGLPALAEAAALLEDLAFAGLDKSKWAFAAPADMARVINDDDHNVAIIERFCRLVKERLCAEGLSGQKGDFLIPHAEDVMLKIKDSAIRSLHIMEG